jgi:hypothetical protein
LLSASGDQSVYQATEGGGGTGGSFAFHLRIPLALNKRDLVGLLGNQDRSQQYQLRTNFAPSASIYSTAPTALPVITSIRNYGSYAVPNAVDETGQQNQVTPPTYGVITYLTKTLSDAPPLGGSQVNHYIRRVGNAIRLMALIFRKNGTRLASEAALGDGLNMPSNIQLKVGDQILLNEGFGHRRRLMFDRYGFDSPKGMLVYDFIHDFSQFAGAELYHDWLWSENLVQAQLLITYPAAVGSTANSLTIATSDVIVPPGINIYQPI